MDFKELQNYPQPIYVIGHKNPDIDSIVSSKILSDILNANGIISNYAVIEGEYPDEYNMRMIKECMNYQPVVIKKKDIANHYYFLVDHNDISQSVGRSDLVIGCIDHHPDSGNITQLILTDHCCAALFLFSLFKNKYDFTKEQKYQIYMAFLNDSIFTKSSRYSKKDEELVSQLGFSNNYETMFKQFFIPTDLTENHRQVFLTNGHKNHTFPDYQFESSYINSFNTLYMDEYREVVENYSGNFLGIWKDYTEGKTYIFFKYNNKFYEKMYDFIASRATTILNDALEMLNSKAKSLLLEK